MLCKDGSVRGKPERLKIRPYAMAVQPIDAAPHQVDSRRIGRADRDLTRPRCRHERIRAPVFGWEPCIETVPRDTSIQGTEDAGEQGRIHRLRIERIHGDRADRRE